MAAAERWLTDWTAETEAITTELADMAARAGEVRATAASSHGEIEVTVGANGELTALQLSADAVRWHPDDLAAEILRTYGDARARCTVALDSVLGDGPVPEASRYDHVR